MLSIAKIPPGVAAAGYAQYQEGEISKNSRSLEDYYSGEQDAGKWTGKLASKLDLEGDIEKGQLLAALQGFDPKTGEALASNAGETHKPGWDLTFSAPKSVSVVWANADSVERSAIERAQAQASTRALSFLEDQGAFISRDRQQGGPVSGVLSASFQHGTSRAGDPDLHNHCTVFNLHQRADGSHGSIEFDLRWKMAAGAMYRAELANEMQKLGYGIERDADSFKLSGVDKTVCDEFSTRRKQILELDPQTAKQAERAALHTRDAKPETSRAELLNDWQTRSQALGFDLEKSRSTPALTPIDEQGNPLPDPLSRDQLLAKLTEHDSVIGRHDVYRTVAVASQGKLDAAGIEAKVDELLQDRDLVKMRAKTSELTNDSRDPRNTESRFTTREMLAVERQMTDQGKALSLDKSRTIAPEKVTEGIAAFEQRKGFQLSEEQRNAVRHVTSPGNLAVVRGAAGAGKTTMLEAGKDVWQADGRRVFGAALAGKAAAGMQEVGIQSSTIAKLLYTNADPLKSEFHLRKNDVLVIDEAGMVDSRTMNKLTNLATERNFKLVLVGDEKQLQAIGAGGAFKAMQTAVGDRAELVENRRQRDAADRIATDQVASGEGGKALLSYIERDKITIHNNKDDAAQALMNDWKNDARPDRDKLILAATNADVNQLNDLARQAVGDRLGDDFKVSTRYGNRDFATGDRILFRKNNADLDVKNGHLGTVENIKLVEQNGAVGQQFSVLTDHGARVQFVLGDQDGQYNSIDHGYAVTVHKSQGATVDSAYNFGLGNKEMGYVQFSRHRDENRIYMTDAQLDRVEYDAGVTSDDSASKMARLQTAAKSLSRENEKETTLDYQEVAPAVETVSPTASSAVSPAVSPAAIGIVEQASKPDYGMEMEP